MGINIILSKDFSVKKHLVVIVNKQTNFKHFFKNSEEIELIKKKLINSSFVNYNESGRVICFIKESENNDKNKRKEHSRISGSEISFFCTKEKIKQIQIIGNKENILPTIEGLLLANYQFLKYKTTPVSNPLKKIILISDKISKSEIAELQNLIEGTYIARNLVNEPAIHLSANQLSDEIRKLGKDAGFKVEVFHKLKIESLKMGGLLSVNKGSTEPPTFNVLEYKPAKAINKKPYILVGKGVVFDTGGLSIKSSEGMEKMKCDMAGAASVIGSIYTIAKNKLPIHIIGLIPATDNRVNSNAISPGDVITISNGKTVEVLNTDAEGRLILADALSYASRFKPELVIDLATLTGAAVRAIGNEGIVFMGNTSKKTKDAILKSGEEVHERLVEFPLWEEYAKQLESDIADIKNIGNGDAGAITAGKFLEYFVDYDWLHLDIAGPAFISHQDNYRSKNATGVGVRLLYNFFKTITE